MNKRITKRALFMSFVSLFICFTMLLGTTYAWFTDSVSSGVNTIVSGNLDIGLYHSSKTVAKEPVGIGTKLFALSDDHKWEPGAMVYERFTIVNEGNLALKYQFTINAQNATVVRDADGNPVSFADMLKVVVIEDKNFDYSNRENIKALTSWKNLETFSLGGELNAPDPVSITNPHDVFGDVYGVVIYWEPSDNDYLFNMKDGTTVSVDLGVNLFATQMEAEIDSFGDDYDEEADDSTTASTTVVADIPTKVTAPIAPSATNAVTILEAPANAFNQGEKVGMIVTPTNSLFEVTAGGAVVGSLDITLTVDGNEKTYYDGSVTYTVTTYISRGLADVEVNFNGTGDAPTLVSYNAETGKLVFTTTHFSEYELRGSAVAYDVKADMAYADYAKAAEAIVEAKKANAKSNIIIVSDANVDAIITNINNIVDNDRTLSDAEKEAVKSEAGKDLFLAAETFEALTDAVAAGYNVRLADDITVTSTVTVPAGADIVLDLNGNDLSYAVTNSVASAIINNSGKLEIKGEGTISFVAENPDTNVIPAYATNTITNVGTLIIGEGVTVTNGSDGGASYAVDNHGVFTLNGGTLIGNRCALRVARYNQDNVVFTMNSGVVEGETPMWIQLPGNDSSVAPNITVNVNGGTVKTTKASSGENNIMYTYSYGNSHANTTLNITGGEFLGGVVSIGSGYKGDVPALNISGGVFEYDVLQWLEGDVVNVVYPANK